MILFEGESVLGGGKCDRDSCTLDATDGTTCITLDDVGIAEEELREFSPDDPPSLVEDEDVIGTRDGVSWFRQSESGGEYADVFSMYGGWMKETVLGVRRAGSCSS